MTKVNVKEPFDFIKHPIIGGRMTFLKYLKNRCKHAFIGSRVSKYINDLLIRSEGGIFRKMIKESEAIPYADLQVSYDQGRFLESMIRSTNAKRVLEIGTFRGFSTIFIARALPSGGLVITCDKRDAETSLAQESWKKLGLEHKIDKRLGAGVAVLAILAKEQEEKSLPLFDLIFIDADKGSYKDYIDMSMIVLKPGGTILIDNVLWAGLPTYKQPGDNTGHAVREFNEYVFDTYAAYASIIPAWDGMMLITKPII